MAFSSGFPIYKLQDKGYYNINLFAPFDNNQQEGIYVSNPDS